MSVSIRFAEGRFCRNIRVLCTYANSFQGDHGKRKLALESASRRQKLPRNAGHSPIRLRKSVTSESDGLELSALEPLSAHDIPNEKQHQEGDGECPADDQSRIPSLAEDRVAGAWFTDEVGVELRESNGKDRDAGDQSWPRRDAHRNRSSPLPRPHAPDAARNPPMPEPSATMIRFFVSFLSLSDLVGARDAA